MVFSSWRSYWDFARSVSSELRYFRSPEAESFLESVLCTSSKRQIKIKENSVLWRAQIGHDWRTETHHGEDFDVECAYRPNRMKPIPNRAMDGRVNPKGIPCLYLAKQKDTAICEVRPWIGSYVSIAQFKTCRELKIINCSQIIDTPVYYFQEPDPCERETAVWSSINKAFSTPMTRGDDSPDYVPTQIITEVFKKAGFDGIAYKSNFGEDGCNVALFDLEAASVINCALVRINKIQMEYSQSDNPYFVSQNKDSP
jgi:hypothetical protein